MSSYVNITSNQTILTRLIL